MQIRRLQPKHAQYHPFCIEGKLSNAAFHISCVINLFANMQISNIVLRMQKKSIRMQALREFRDSERF